MNRIKIYIFIIVVICFALFLSSCNNLKQSGNKNGATQIESHSFSDSHNSAEENKEIVWDEINKQGVVDENLLIKNIDQETLTYVAQQLQSICKEIAEKGEKDKNYWLTSQWYIDIVNSKQYKNVVALNKKAMKPLFLIIYKSPNAGMYEWTCSKALDEISGFDFSGKNNDRTWSNSKEFLKVFINTIIEKRN